jgi:hypothetical protein
MPIGAIASRMGFEWIQMASQGLSGADADTRAWRRRFEAPNDNLDDDIWPEVSTRYSRESPVPIKSENSPGRIWLEIAMAFAAAGALAAVIAILLPGGLSQ